MVLAARADLAPRPKVDPASQSQQTPMRSFSGFQRQAKEQVLTRQDMCLSSRSRSKAKSQRRQAAWKQGAPQLICQPGGCQSCRDVSKDDLHHRGIFKMATSISKLLVAGSSSFLNHCLAVDWGFDSNEQLSLDKQSTARFVRRCTSLL